ncbi:hypothetical protein JNUCC0626_20025 [Lentzea sp. JNUCC 0626]|uniref:hypothetical protein n=1 Tax=Lentzea sp. JNUCC 0626 TaxID=3367513 RepID=UPI00374A7312
MGEPLRRYAVVVNGYATHMRLNQADAERLGATLDEPAEQATTEQAPADERTPAKARRAKNKARTPADK